MAKSKFFNETETTENNSEMVQNTTKKKPVFKTIDDSLETWDFKIDPIFTGQYVKFATLGEGEKEFHMHVLTHDESGEDFYIPTCHSIDKAIEKATEAEDCSPQELMFRFEFLGKAEVNGKPFNRFKTAYYRIED